MEATATTAASPTTPAFATQARQVFLSWEILRLVYNVVLGLFVLALVRGYLFTPFVLIQVVEGALLANLCFFAGPAIELYIRWLGYQHLWVRWVFFLSGTLLTGALALVGLSPYWMPTS